jgi:ribosome biogenesis GTPase
LTEGLIIKGVGGLYTVMTEEGEFLCKARGIFRKDLISPMPGDKVVIGDIEKVKKTAVIEKIHERKNFLIRPAVANVDNIVLVIAAGSPQPDFLLVDKLLVEAGSKGIDVHLVINKVDQDSKNAIKIKKSYEDAVRYISLTCALKIHENFLTRQGISVFAGQSGAGKSTLINAVAGTFLMQTGEISHKTERGRHTTRHSQMISIGEGSYIIDSPGFSLFGLSGIASIDLQEYYPEMCDSRGKCKFLNCSHINEPDCAVKDLVVSGKFDEGRYNRYIEIYNELRIQEQNKYK